MTARLRCNVGLALEDFFRDRSTLAGSIRSSGQRSRQHLPSGAGPSGPAVRVAALYRGTTSLNPPFVETRSIVRQVKFWKADRADLEACKASERFGLVSICNHIWAHALTQRRYRSVWETSCAGWRCPPSVRVVAAGLAK